MVHVMHIQEILGNADTPSRQAWERQFTFVGWQRGWYVLLLRASPTPEVQAFRERVLERLIEQQIASDLTDGNRRLWLLLRRASDVLQFQREFGARSVTPETIFAALRAEASIQHREKLLRN